MSVVVTDLMKEWNPIYASINDLRAIMGAPTREAPSFLEYAFDFGLAGVLWRFTISAGTVVGVGWEPLH
jgi:hypothetical protein